MNEETHIGHAPRRSGRPKEGSAASHEAILDAVHALLQETSVRHLTMEAVAKRAGVGKPTLYKWWPSKAALVFAMFHERMDSPPSAASCGSWEEAIRSRVSRLIDEFHGPFGRVMAELIAEGQSDPGVLRELYERHVKARRSDVVADIERAKSKDELNPDVDAEVLVDEIFGPIYYRLLLRIEPLDRDWGQKLIDQVFAGIRATRR